MNDMKSHVTSLELSKKLKEAGYNQMSEYLWSVPNLEQAKTKEEYNTLKACEPMLSNKGWGECFDSYAAPLATELLEELPWRIRDEKSQLDSVLFILPHAESNAVGYKPMHESNTLYEDWNSRNLQDALAWAWLWLKGENRI